MAHIRQQIRARVGAVLAALPGYAATVRDRAFLPMPKIEDEAFYVSTPQEASEYASQGGELQRTITVLVQAVFRGAADNLPATLDDFAVAAEPALAGDATLDGLVLDFRLTGTRIALDGAGEKPLGLIELTYSALVCTAADDPETLS